MKANPGGQLSPSEVVGRDKLIQRLWQILERQSLVLTAERRMGKTSVIKKMEADPLPDKLIIFRDLEGLRTPLEFVETVLEDVEHYLSRFQQTAARTREFLRQLSGLEVKGVKLPSIAAPEWKALLTKTIEDLVAYQERTLIFLWDEMPMMLDNIQQDSSEKVAMELLDTLRSLRQMSPTVRMVYTGSIGLHHVISSLKQAGYANAPTNDMYIQELPPLSLGDAQNLAEQLLVGEDIFTENLSATATAIAQAVDCIPFYIHHVVDQMKWWEGNLNPATVTQIVDASLTDPMNRWDMAHYRERIDVYYDDVKRTIALNVLDELAVAAQPMAFEELLNRLGWHVATVNREQVRDVLTLLQRDHYIAQQSSGAYGFQYSLIQRYWRLSRGLTA